MSFEAFSADVALNVREARNGRKLEGQGECALR